MDNLYSQTSSIFVNFFENSLFWSILSIVLLTIFLKSYKNTPKSLKGEIVFLTGGGNGIGKEMALLLAKEGAKVAIIDNDKEGADLVLAKILIENNTGISIKCDITSLAEIKKAAEIVRLRLGNPTIIVNNAGILISNTLPNFTKEEIDSTFNVNVLPHFYIIKEFLPDMLKANKGHIVSMCSLAGFFGGKKASLYTSSKFAVMGLNESLKAELTALNSKIQTLVVCPHFVNTRMVNNLAVKSDKSATFLSPEFVAKKVIEGIKYNKKLVLLPEILATSLIMIKSLVPTTFFDSFLNFLGLNKAY